MLVQNCVLDSAAGQIVNRQFDVAVSVLAAGARFIRHGADHMLLIGSVANKAGRRPGPTRQRRIDGLPIWPAAPSSTTILHELIKKPTDHDAPAFLIRPDGRYLAVYTRHTYETVYVRWRVSTNPHDALHWDDEKTFDWSQPPALHWQKHIHVFQLVLHLPTEKRTYDFVRAVNRDPSFLISTDDGSNWSYGGKLLTDKNVGYVDGYVKYASNGRDRIDFVTTDHHHAISTTAFITVMCRTGNWTIRWHCLRARSLFDSTASKRLHQQPMEKS